MSGDIHITANTPRRAMAISTPMASDISLPLNHLAMALDTVVPAISQPQPNIMKPREAILALPGSAVHQLLSHSQNAVPWNQELIPTYFMHAPITINDAENPTTLGYFSAYHSTRMPAIQFEKKSLEFYDDIMESKKRKFEGE